MKQAVNVTTTGGVAVITLDNPPVNAWSLAQRAAFVDAYQRLCADDDVRAIVVTGAGNAFCAGADIAEFATGRFYESPNLIEVLQPLYHSEKLTVAAINGIALGGGLETALACHYRFASPAAKLRPKSRHVPQANPHRDR